MNYRTDTAAPSFTFLFSEKMFLTRYPVHLKNHHIACMMIRFSIFSLKVTEFKKRGTNITLLEATPMSYSETEKICDGKGKTLNDFNTSVVILIKCTAMDMGKKYALLMVRFCIGVLRIFSLR